MNTHAQNLCKCQSEINHSDHSCSFNPEIFKLTKKAPVKISEGGTPLHILFKDNNIEYCTPCDVVGVGDSIYKYGQESVTSEIFHDRQ